MAGNSGGPWGGGGNRGGSGGGDGNRPGGPRRPGEGQNIPEIDDLVRKGQEQLRVLMGGRGNRNSGNGGGSGGGEFKMSPGMWAIVAAIAVGVWAFNSVYTVQQSERSVELFLGRFSSIGTPGINFAPWPLVTHEVLQVTENQTETLGQGRGSQAGLMLTTDANIVDIDFQVVWNISDPAAFLFNLSDPILTVRAVSEAAMRDIIAQSELAPILNRDRGLVEDTALTQIQQTLNEYESGINVLRVNLDRVDPPDQSVVVTDVDGQSETISVIDAFRDVQAAEQERDQFERQADAYANRVTAEARGEAAQVLEAAEGYRARVVNEAEGSASRFSAILTEYQNAPEVTRRRIYLETMEQIYGSLDLVILDDTVTGGEGGGTGVVPYLPLNELRNQTQGGSN